MTRVTLKEIEEEEEENPGCCASSYSKCFPEKDSDGCTTLEYYFAE